MCVCVFVILPLTNSAIGVTVKHVSTCCAVFKFNKHFHSLSSLYNDEMSDEDELTDNMTDSMGINRSGVKGLKWTKTEDNMLKTLVEQYGEKWDMISSELKDRSDIQCQQRWTKVVNPDLIKGPWTKEVK